MRAGTGELSHADGSQLHHQAERRPEPGRPRTHLNRSAKTRSRCWRRPNGGGPDIDDISRVFNFDLPDDHGDLRSPHPGGPGARRKKPASPFRWSRRPRNAACAWWDLHPPEHPRRTAERGCDPRPPRAAAAGSWVRNLAPHGRCHHERTGPEARRGRA